MSTPSSISRRIRDAIGAHGRGDYEGALVHFFPALDKAAKRRRPRDGVGQRIRGFLADEEGLISALATGNFIRDISIDGVSFPDAIYRFGRTSIAHEGELDPRLKISADGSLRIGQVWALPPSYITAMCIAVMAAPECSTERIEGDAEVDLLGAKWRLNDLWGAHDRLKAHVATVFRNPHLFER